MKNDTLAPAPLPGALVEEWHVRAANIRRWSGDERVARAYECAADELRSALRMADEGTLGVAEAARLTGYHPESIGRLIRGGSIANYGTKRRPRVKLVELPRKARRSPVAQHQSAGASCVVDSIARDAISSRIGRG